MNVISRLFLMLDQARLQIHRPLGEVFDYSSGFNGLKMIAEVITRGRMAGLASLLLPSDGINNILTLPGGHYHFGFNVDNKLDEIKKPGNYLLLLQSENYLWTGNYILIEVDEDGSDARLYSIYKDSAHPIFLTEIDLSYLESEHQLIDRLYRVAIGEIMEMNEECTESKPTAHSH